MASRQYTAKVEMLRNLGEVTEVLHLGLVSHATYPDVFGKWLLAMSVQYSYATWTRRVCRTVSAESMHVRVVVPAASSYNCLPVVVQRSRYFCPFMLKAQRIFYCSKVLLHSTMVGVA